MSKPTVTLVFAGDHDKLTDSTQKVGSALDRMGGDAEQASGRLRGAGLSADRLAEGTDTAESRAQGFSDVISGVTEGLAAWQDESLSTTEKMMAMGQAGADLAGGMTNFLIPAVAGLSTGLKGGLGSAMSFIAAHPLMFALLAVAAVLVLLWMNSETFRRIVIGAFDAVAGFVTRTLGGAWDWLVGKFRAFVDFHLVMGDRLIGFFRGVGDAIAGAFRGAFNFVSNAWNATIGRLSWTVPGWVPGLAGNQISAPRLPTYHLGGVVDGMPGQEVMAVLRAGERVQPRWQSEQGVAVTFHGNISDPLAEVIMYLVRVGRITLAT